MHLVTGTPRVDIEDKWFKWPMLVFSDETLRLYETGAFHKGKPGQVLLDLDLTQVEALVLPDDSTKPIRVLLNGEVVEFRVVSKLDIQEIGDGLARHLPQTPTADASDRSLSPALARGTGWQDAPDLPTAMAYFDGSAWHPGRISKEALSVPAIVAAPSPECHFEGGEPVFLTFDVTAGLAIVAADAHKKLEKWTWLAPRAFLKLEDLESIEVSVAGKRVSQGGAPGHVAGMATFGLSYDATTKGHEQTFLSANFRDGFALTFFTEVGHATVLEGQLAAFRNAIQRSRATPPVDQENSASGDPAQKIRSLASLRDDELITEDEFQAKKRQILGL